MKFRLIENKPSRMSNSKKSLKESSHRYNMFTIEDEDSHVIIKDLNGVIQSRAEDIEEAHHQIDNELCTSDARINLRNISKEDLDSLCNKLNISIVQEEPINLLYCVLQGGKDNIEHLIYNLKRMKAVE